MPEWERRSFLTTLMAAGAGPLGARTAAARPFRLGVVISLGKNPEAAIKKVHDLGLPTCMVSGSDMSSKAAHSLGGVLKRYDIEVTAVETLGPGEMVWDFLRGPATIGLIPERTRRARMDAMKHASDFATILGIPAIQTHVGFIPEDPSDPKYEGAVTAIREVAAHAKANGQWFLCETGQETPVTLLRAITDIGLDNVGVGLDTANLILYGKGNPVDALDVLGKLVRSVHAKDGFFPTDPRRLGREVRLGAGRVDFPRVIRGLRGLGYTGAITIEREISGPQQIEDLRDAMTYLEKIVRETE
jgi:L-ribulose-5-phosphate 3-epimerase